MASRRAVIVGAGIGGLTAALSLRRAGFEVTVLERTERLDAVGAGISLWPNAVHALGSLGLEAPLKAISAPARGTAMHRRDGKQLGGSLADLLPERFGAPLVLVHRADLQDMLLDAAGRDHVRLGQTVDELPGADLVVGADGVRSAVRRNLFDDAPATYAGYTAWRGVTRLPSPPAATGEFLGRGRLFGIATLPDDRVYWWASERSDEPRQDGLEQLRERYAGWGGPVEDALDATAPRDVIVTPLQARDPAPAMARDHVALLGDAAHAMLPNLGQGGGQAIEDAMVLGGVLDGADDVPAALQRYAELRGAHTASVVKASAQVARIVHLQNPLAVALRNTAMRATPPKSSLKRLQPIVGYAAHLDVDAGPGPSRP